MSKALDITGQKFGFLTAIKRVENQGAKTCWLFKCDCGNEKIAQTGHVTSGRVKSCGCQSNSLSKTIRICPICNKEFTITNFAQINRKYCFECSPSTNNPTTKSKAIRDRLIADRGGKCERCGYNRCNAALEFHHLDPNEKEFAISNSGMPSFEKVKEEADKCILLCANCHREEHELLRKEI